MVSTLSMGSIFLIVDKDIDEVFQYILEDTNVTLKSILDSYTINGRRIAYKGRYMYCNQDGEVGTPVNSIDILLSDLNIVDDGVGSLYISDKSGLHSSSVPNLKL
jgi:hypothetical protein